jgi:type IV pilus assembly protein PilX
MKSDQRGMTLLIGLILLVMLTVIGTIGFRNTTMSERMTGNMLDRNVSFQSAESAGKEALTAIEGGTASTLSPGYFATPLSQGGTTSFWTQGDGAAVANVANCPTTTPFSWQSCAAQVVTKYANNDSKARYVIELLKQDTSSGTSTVWSYRVTSRSTGGSGNADVVLQTVYVRTTTP